MKIKNKRKHCKYKESERLMKKDNIGYLLAAVLFLIAGIFEFIAHKLPIGFAFISLGFSFLSLYFNRNKTKNDARNIDLDIFEIVKKDKKFRELIFEGKKIAAVKRCRSLTDCGLKEAEVYVNSLENLV